MIEFLSNPSWINPQVDFLLFLQNFRVGNLESLDKFFLHITIFGEYFLSSIICAVVYWCIDLKTGIYLFSLNGLNILLAHFFKMLSCVYRPWVLNENLHPSALAIPYAKGYSFPSGHSAMASSVIGGVAYVLKNKKWLCFSLIGLIFLIGFSRLWLGVHTPQDVVCGLLIGFLLVFVLNFLINWAEKDKNRYLYCLFFINILAIFALIYVKFFNSYKLDYVSGELLVDPQKSLYVMFIVYGFALGLINGCFLCGRLSVFNPKEGTLKNKIIRGIIGITILFLLFKFVLEYIFMNIISLKIAMPVMFLIGLFITFIYPVIFKKFQK